MKPFLEYPRDNANAATLTLVDVERLEELTKTSHQRDTKILTNNPAQQLNVCRDVVIRPTTKKKRAP